MTPVQNLCDKDEYQSNYVSNPNLLYGEGATERSDYNEWHLATRKINHYSLSECVLNSPTMAANQVQNSLVVPGEG